MRERVCKNCGGREYKVVGQNMVKCKFCGTLYVDEQSSKEEEVLLVKASEFLRECRFDEGVSEFDDILTLFPMSFEAYFGKALAKHKIVLYLNKSGTKKRPRFFGELESISEDDDFKKAIELAPSETQKTYTYIANRIDRIKRAVENKAEEEKIFDLILCENFADFPENLKKTTGKLKEKYKCYDLNNLPMNERERDTFPALVSSKIFVLFADADKNLGEYKHLFDRYAYFVSQRKKVRSSFIVCVKGGKESGGDLPKYLNFASNFVDLSEDSFEQNLFDLISTEFEKTPLSTAKIEKIEIKNGDPQKKEYVDVESISPTELGSYTVDNMEMQNSTKVKWIFLSLKNGDFETAKKTIAEELAKDPYSAELLFASIMADKQIKTQDDFFSSISNFKDKPMIDKILSFASRDFAQNFVDRWENLIISLDGEEYYNAFLLYLAKFNTPNRENFVAKAEEKAIYTENELLIENVLKCFDKKDVSRYVDFYSKLAERYEKQEYYQKVLELDPGHSQSNISLLLSKFKTDQDKLSYQNRTEIEEVLKFLDESARAQFVEQVVEMVLPISFYDIEQAQKQLDFYLGYVDDKFIVNILHKIAMAFQQMGFFKEAERYLSIAISKEARAPFYWDLIKIKAHCKSDSELIMSNIKIMDMPEWDTLLELSPDEEDERYAGIVSKNNLYKGERKKFEPGLLDKVLMKEKLQQFLLRNRQILQSCEKEKAELARGVDYYFAQLRPFEKYISQIDSEKSFEGYLNIVQKIRQRLDALDLSLDTSLNLLSMQAKSEGMKNVEMPKTEEIRQKIKKKLKNDRFLKGFLIIFLEIFPLAFATMLFLICAFLPKEVYLYFNREFLVTLLLTGTAIAVGNIVFYYARHKRWSKKTKFLTTFLFSLGAINLVLFCCCFYIIPNKIEITDAREMQVLLKNAPHEDFVLANDIDFNGESFDANNFSGTFDGQNYIISNIKLSNGLFYENSGEIKNVNVILSQNNEMNSYFGGIAAINYGKISDCFVAGEVIFSGETLVGGGIVATNYAEISNCQSSVNFQIVSGDVTVGGICGSVKEGKNKIVMFQNLYAGSIDVSTTQKADIGGIAGKLANVVDENIDLSQNLARANITLLGTGEISVGGLVGFGESRSENNRSEGLIDFTDFEGTGFAGGLYGQYLAKDVFSSRIQKSVSTSNFVQNKSGSVGIGALVGNLAGRIENSFATGSENIVFGQPQNHGSTGNCQAGPDKTYNSSYSFSSEIWDLSGPIPKFLWEE